MSTADDVPFVTPDSPALAERCATLGNYYIVAAHSHDVLARHVNVEQLARDLGLMPDHVVVKDDYTHTAGMGPAEIRSMEVLR